MKKKRNIRIKLKFIIILFFLNIHFALFPQNSNEWFESIRKRNETAILKMINDGFNVNIKDENSNYSGLILAAEVGYFDICKLLLNNGAHVNSKDNKGFNALFYASINGYKEIVDLLIKNHIDISSRDKDGNNVLMHIPKNNKKEIIGILIKNGADVDEYNFYENNPLKNAIESGDLEMITILIENEANISSELINFARDKGRDAVIKLLNEKNDERDKWNEDIYNNMMSGINYFDKQDYTNAILEFEKNLNYNSNEIINVSSYGGSKGGRHFTGADYEGQSYRMQPFGRYLAYDNYWFSVYYSGLCHYYLKDYKKALDKFTLCKKAMAKWDKPFFMIGLCFDELGEKQKAIESLEEFNSYINNDILWNLGWYNFVAGNYERTTYYGRQSYLNNNLIVGPVYNTGLAYLLLKDYENAFIWYSKAIANSNDDENFINTSISLINRYVINVNSFSVTKDGKTADNNPDRDFTYFILWALYKKQQNYQEENKYFELIKKSDGLEKLLLQIKKNKNGETEGNYYLSCFFSLKGNMETAFDLLNEYCGNSLLKFNHLIENDQDLINLKASYILNEKKNIISNTRLLVQQNHSDNINGIYCSPDNKTIVTTDKESTILWSFNGIIINKFNASPGNLVFTSDSNYIIYYDNPRIVIRAKDGILLKEIVLNNEIIINDTRFQDFKVTNDCRYLVYLFDNKLHVFDLKYFLNIENGISDMNNIEAFYTTTDDKYLVAHNEKNFHVFDISENFKDISDKFPRIDNILDVKLSFDNKYFGCATNDSVIIADFAGVKKIIDIRKDKLFDDSFKPLKLCFSPKSDMVAFTNGAFTYTYNLENGNILKINTKETDYKLNITFSTNNNYFILNEKTWNINGEKSTVFDKDNETSDNEYYFSEDKAYYIKNNSKSYRANEIGMRIFNNSNSLINNIKEKIFEITISNDSNFIIGSTEDKKIKIWDRNGELLREYGLYIPALRNCDIIENKILCSCYSFDLEYLDKSKIKLWSIDKLVSESLNEANNINCISIRNDGQYIANRTGRTIQLLKKINDKYSNYSAYSFTKENTEVENIHFSSDNRYLITSHYNDAVRIWKINETEQKLILITNLESVPEFDDDGSSAGGVGEDSYTNNAFYFNNNNQIIVSNRNIIKIYSEEWDLIKSFDATNLGGIEAICTSPDDKYIATGTRKKMVNLYSVEKGFLRTFYGHTSEVTRVIFSKSSDRIISSSKDGTIKFWTLEGDLIKTLNNGYSINDFSLSKDDKYLTAVCSDGSIKIWNLTDENYVSVVFSAENWLIYTPDGFWDSSKYGSDLIAYVKGFETYRIDQFAAKYNRPDVIMQRLGIDNPDLINNYYNQYKKRLRKLGLKEEDLSGEFYVPETKIIEHIKNEKFMKVKFELKDEKYQLSRYNIYINDVPIFGAYGKEIKNSKTAHIASLQESIELSSGDNKIEISCMNERGAESYRALTYANYNKPVKQDLYYIGFGVSEYKNSRLNLNYAHKDCTDLADLYNKDKLKYNNVYTYTFINNQVTIENIRKAKELLKNAKPDDTFVLFIAGHGVHDTDKEATYYFLTYNTDLNNLSGTAANFDLIEDILQGIPPRNKLFLMDTCESGEVDETMISSSENLEKNTRSVRARAIETDRGMETKKKIEKKKIRIRTYLFDKDRYIYNDLSRRSGSIVFSSCKGGEYSYEDSILQNGYFTSKIKEAIGGKKSDRDHDGMISIDELRDYVTREVSELSKGLQNPTVDRDNIYQKFGF